MVDQFEIDRPQWLGLLAELRRRGQGRHESGAFLLGRLEPGRRVVEACLFYDDLDRHAYATGVCVLHADSFDAVWRTCRARGLTVVADVHTHAGGSWQSRADRESPMVARAGHIALIVERFAANPVWRHRLGVYRYEGAHRWTDLSGWTARTFLKTGTLV